MQHAGRANTQQHNHTQDPTSDMDVFYGSRLGRSHNGQCSLQDLRSALRRSLPDGSRRSKYLRWLDLHHGLLVVSYA